ncbi:hypothetical protein BDW02DRAFT_575917 [Decorospora gaudefroyi]|uniref:BZIP domain-containing protein n=1 Tax=Decorospora gaudefroyi TaxID=184978 RepID=A0A6A5KUC1_9PLEO|nr:hypothetical protein BDW02DRAFT_575917 [Decorospora gaudefroyi]
MTASVLMQYNNTNPHNNAENEDYRTVQGMSRYEDCWPTIYGGNRCLSDTNGFNTFSPKDQNRWQLETSQLEPNLQQQSPGANVIPFQDPIAQATHPHFGFASETDATAHIRSPANLSSPSIYRATNASARAHNLATISPLQTNFHTNTPSPTYSNISPKRRRDSLYPKQEEASSERTQASAGRRRQSEYAAPGSARAIYLEKNRKAASKCRSKQKMEQEVLVERAREEERRNRLLKAEVELLQAELRNIKEVVGQHANCPDSRMTRYMQGEADRLASASIRHQF